MTYPSISYLCHRIINGYAEGKSGMDDEMLQALIDLGDQAEFIIALEDALDEKAALAIEMSSRWGREQKRVTELRVALQVLLDHVDYTAGACGLAEPVGGALPREVLALAKSKLKENQ